VTTRRVSPPPAATTPAATVAALRDVANRFGADAAGKSVLLRRASAMAQMDVATLLAYHDVLLFLIAYPETSAMRALAGRELARVADLARDFAVVGPARARARLRGTGIAWSATTIAFSLPIARWLLARYPACAEIDSFGDGGARLAEWLRHALPPAEFALADAGEDAPESLVDAGIEGWHGSRLGWLLSRLDRLPCAAALRETLFDSLEPFITLLPHATPLSRTFARAPGAPVYFHRAALLRGADVDRLLAEPLPPWRRLTRGERAKLVDTGRAILAMLGRETDPITHADVQRTRYVAVGRGVALALYCASPERRNPLDTHIGYVLFKNAVPVGYGGGWPFLGRCKIGINIFPAFRGGESAYLMATVMQVYAQLFAVERFVVEPYQFGAGNREGLQSGAFWFYYRLGFRPAHAALGALAATEFARMSAERGYRPSLRILRRFTRADLERVVAEGAPPACDPAELSEAVTAWIRARFHGQRERATAFAERAVIAALDLRGVELWNAPQRAALRALAPVLAQIRGLPAWPLQDKRRLAAMIRAKGADEYRYFALMAGFARLRTGLDDVAARRLERAERATRGGLP
jgi:hypothetical protein